jgi:hypothetical protein
MKPETSLPRSQNPAIGPYPEPSVSNPPFHALFPKIDFSIILPSVLRFPNWSDPFKFSNENVNAFLISPIHASLITPMLIHIMKLLIINSIHPGGYFLFLRSIYYYQHFSNTIYVLSFKGELVHHF